MKILLTVFPPLLLQLGLAILGWGGFAGFFSHPPLAVMTALTVLMGVAALFTQGNLSAGEREDRSNRWVLWAFTVLSILLAYVPAYCDRHGLWTLGGDSLRWAGLAVFTVGGVLRLWPVFVLGRRFSGLVAIQRDHELVTSGIYRRVRNPSYLGLLLGALGWALVFRSVLGVVITLLLLIPLCGRMRAEEQLLAEHFGAEYESYRQRTWRLFPGVY